MVFRVFSLAAAIVLAPLANLVHAAEYQRTGDWVFHSKATAASEDAIWSSCVTSSETADGTEFSLTFDPAPDNRFDVGMALSRDNWEIGSGPVRVRFDIGADHWILPGAGDGSAVEVDWTGDPHLLSFLEDLASSSFAKLIAADGSTLAQFSLTGSRGAIEAVKTCIEDQIGQGLGEGLGQELGQGLAADATDAANPF